jgi:hypothetical protein
MSIVEDGAMEMTWMSKVAPGDSLFDDSDGAGMAEGVVEQPELSKMSARDRRGGGSTQWQQNCL